MTSGTFRSLPISSITINRGERQRRELTGIEELAESIHRIGLINPIVVSSESVLVAGERRLTACKSLGWTSIPVQFAEDLSDYELASIELEENIKRVDLTWQDEVRAVERFHQLKASHEDRWSQEQTAAALGYTQPEVARKLAVAKELSNETVAKAEKFSVAHNIVQRNTERRKSSVLEAIAPAAQLEGESPGAPELPPPPIIHSDFHLWQESYDGPKFNLLHCDFPYGINVADGPRQNSTIKDYYRDSPDIYWSLLERLALAMENVVADSAHLIFWFSMDYFSQTQEALGTMGWRVNPFPLVWYKNDNAGIAPDPQRGPRRIYETAFFAHRGDRKLTEVGAKANAFAHPGNRSEAIHISEKPKVMLQHFLSMVCDEYSTVLDPTCGSGNALKVAQALGASSVLGIEQNEEFYSIACENWHG